MFSKSLVFLTFVVSCGAHAQDSCRAAFSPSEELHYQREVWARREYTDTDLVTMATFSKKFDVTSRELFARVERLKNLADRELALSLNNRELILLASATAQTPIEVVVSTFKTLLVEVKVEPPGGRKINVPHQIIARLTALSLITGDAAGSVAYEYRSNFVRSLTIGPMSFEDLVLAPPPTTKALRLTVEGSALASTSVARLIQD